MSKENSEQCISCKITSVSALVAIGSYLIHQGIRTKLKTYLILGTATISLGILEIFDDGIIKKHKDNNHTKSNE